MKTVVLAFVFVLALPLAISAQDETNEPEGFNFIIGPRIGYSYAFMSQADFSSLVGQVFPAGSYSPATTVFGLSLEQRILLGQTRSHFAFQEVLAIHGLEQSIALPVLAALIGYRDGSGIEAGIGPMLSANGISVLAAFGYTFSFKGVYIPVDLSMTIPNSKSATLLSVTSGFNFIIEKKKGIGP
ncbi:MAG TPA: hypothetical protein VMV83_05155 [Rectinemataceae bacterium]|nr:hypothetical protein [Rectinemataceae bacterium]